ncbi:MAG: amidohydrolase family protein [Steroidobacteraceae bacterium]
MQAITDQTNLPLAIAAARGTGATAIKIYADLPASLVKSITAEAHRQHLLVWSHAAVFPALPSDVADAGVDVMSHACLLGYQLSDPPLVTNEDRTPVDAHKASRPNAAVSALLGSMRQHGAILDATVHVYTSSPTASCSGELSDYLAREAYQAGIPISAGTDDDPDWRDPDSALFSELAELVNKVGMSPAEALRSATVIGAQAAGQQADAGSIASGKLANLVVLEKDPLQDITNLRSVFMVVKHGKRYARSEYKPVTVDEMKPYSE